jgi:large subunit ribosomal protein L4
VLITLYDFPSFRPISFTEYPSTHLQLPLRRDLLHRAVIFEGDATRQGSANTKWRSEVHGSGRKLRPQKGTGRARLGDRKSPMLRGGGVAHGPKPRDFATGLQRKVYDLAWRTALSYRYRRGELVVVESIWSKRRMEMGPTKLAALAEAFAEPDARSESERWEEEEQNNGWSSVKPTLWILRKTQNKCYPFKTALEKYWPNDKVRGIDKVDIKNILEGRRIVIEKEALDTLLEKHQCDLRPAVDIRAAKAKQLEDAEKMQIAVEQMTSQMRAAAVVDSMSQTVESLEDETGTTIERAKKLLGGHLEKPQ